MLSVLSGGRRLWVGMLPRSIEIACIDPHQTGFVGKGSIDHLQLIKFWPSSAPGKGSVAGRKFFGPFLLIQPARSVCVSLSAFSFKLLTSLPIFQQVGRQYYERT